AGFFFTISVLCNPSLRRPIRHDGLRGRNRDSTTYHSFTWCIRSIIAAIPRQEIGGSEMRRVSRTSMGFAAATALLWSSTAMAEPEIGAVIQQDYSGAVGTRTAGQSEDLVYTQTLFAEERVDTSETASTSLEFLDKTSL